MTGSASRKAGRKGHNQTRVQDSVTHLTHAFMTKQIFPGEKYPNMFVYFGIPTPGHTQDEIRDAIMSHLRQARATGLGDPDEPPAAVSESDTRSEAETLDAARDVLSQTRALRQALSSPV